MTNKKKISLFVLPFFLLPALLSSPLFSDEDTPSNFFELENGIKVFLYERHTLPLFHLVIGFNTGTKDEVAENSGLLHILEHYTLFRGTKSRSGTEISKNVRRHGAYFNAHTGIDLVSFEISLPKEHAEFALNNQKDILFNPQFDDEEVEKEKKIILEELNQMEDDPMRYATSLVYGHLFPGHPYERPVHGTIEGIKTTTAAKLQDFYSEHFSTSNCALAAVGDFSIEEMESKIRNIYGLIPPKDITVTSYPKASDLPDNVEIEKTMDVEEGYMAIGIQGPDYNHPDQYALHLLTEMLGRGVTPMLNAHLRGRRDLIHTVNMTYSSYQYGGAIIIYLTLEPNKMKAASRETMRFLKDTRRGRYSKDDFMGEVKIDALDYLESAKNQIRYKILQSQENGLVVANSLVRYILINDDTRRGSYLENIEKISSSDIRKAAGTYLGKGKYVIVSIKPNKKKNP
ncbi:MAG: insulinase family protein [Candidatus Aminicenantes bacterium]|nr:insulinase family protein [Candidatus Aminicenantes bacterium]